MNEPRGEQLGRYQLIKRLAGGGMAEVYLARFAGAAGFERDVVLKRIRPDLATSAEFVRMLLDEARIAATLHHPNLVQAFDVEEVEGEYFIAMEYLDGIDLRNVQAILEQRDEMMPLENALHIGAGLAAGLEHAHQKTDAQGRPLRIVHRDVSPHNVLLTREGVVKLVDFGIAKSANRQTETSHGGLKGKLGYMSPEQVRGEALDSRSDLFSLGIILYELTTGSYLYAGRSEYQILYEIAEGQVEPPSNIDPEYPPELERILLKVLTKDPENRYASAGELQADLEEFAAKRALSLSSRSLARLVVEFADEHAAAGRDEKTFTPWVANLALKAGAAELSLEEALSSLDEGSLPSISDEEPTRVDTPRPAEPSGKGRPPWNDEIGLADTQKAPSLEEALDALGAIPGADVQADIDATAELRSGRRGLWIATLVLALAVVALGYWVATIEPEPEPEPPPPPEEPPAGTVDIAGSPEGAGVWLHLGETPAQSVPLSTRAPHQLRVELAGHAPRDLTVLPSRWAERRGEIGVWVNAELEPSPDGPGPAANRVPGPPEDDGFAATVSGEGTIHVASEPEGADVWLLVGLLPDVSLGNVRADQGYRVRVAKPGFEPRSLDVQPEAFEPSDEGARASFEVELERR